MSMTDAELRRLSGDTQTVSVVTAMIVCMFACTRVLNTQATVRPGDLEAMAIEPFWVGRCFNRTSTPFDTFHTVVARKRKRSKSKLTRTSRVLMKRSEAALLTGSHVAKIRT